MATLTDAKKVACRNPNTGGKLNIEKTIYDLFSKAIHQVVKEGGSLTYSQIAKGVQDYFQKQKIKFDGSVGWYTVTIKNEMQASGLIEVFTAKGRKMHRLK